MLDLLNEIDSRHDQIKELIGHIKLLENNSNNLFLRSSSVTNKTRRKQILRSKETNQEGNKEEVLYMVEQISTTSDLTAILKGNLVVMVYNLIEYIIINLVDRIYLEIKNYEFSNLKEEIKVVIGKDFKNCGSVNLTGQELVSRLLIIPGITKGINFFGYEIKKETGNFNHLGGNIDAKKIKDLGEAYGFKLPKQDKTSKADHLTNFKTHRNKLAHGENSFVQIGGGYSIENLENNIIQTVNYLKGLQVKVKEYIDSKEFIA